MDDFDISGEVVDQTLIELDVINRLLGGNQISLKAFRKLLKTHSIGSLADLGCGGGDIIIAMDHIAEQNKQEVQFTGVDANPNIAAYARKNTSSIRQIEISSENILDETFWIRKFDVIHCCLFTHHFTDEQLVDLLLKFKSSARHAIIINDLHRHWLAYYAINLLTRFFSKSYMVKHDAALSVLRGFRRKELKNILHQAGISNYQLRWRWAFRWELIIQLS